MSPFRPALALAVAVLALLAAPPALAEDVPRTVTFQGRLVRADGTPENSAQDLTFALYTSPTGGTPIWQESHLGVPVTNGYYAVVLGSVLPLRDEVVQRAELHLGVSLAGQSELTPRLRMASVPFALRASDSQRLEGRAADSFADLKHTHANASTTAAGFMSAADKSKLDAPATDYGDGLNVTGASPPTVSVAFPNASSTNGTTTIAARSNHAHAVATASAAGFMSAADKTKLDAPATTFGTGLTVTGSSPANVTVSFPTASSTNGNSTLAARADHTHAKPTLACTYRNASGNDSGDARGAIAWCVSGETLMGGGCGGMEAGSASLNFLPVGVTFVETSTNTGGPGYRCRPPAASTQTADAYAICCRIP